MMANRGVQHERGWNTFLWIAGSAHFALVYTLNTQTMLNLALFVQGRERAPFQYRALTAWILGSAEHLVHLPAALASSLPPRMDSVESFTVAGIAFVAMLAAVYATRRTLELLTADECSSRWWALLVVVMAYFHYLLAFGRPCCAPLLLPYDLPSVAFFALGLWAVVGRRVWLLYPLLFVATLNRESSVFLVAIYFLYQVGMARDVARARQVLRAPLLHSVAMLAVCLLTLVAVHRLFPHAQPGLGTLGPFENHSLDNFRLVLRPYYWASYLSMFGFSWMYVYANWRRVPQAGIRYALAAGPLMLAAMWVVGVLSEIRIFGELISLFTVAFALLLRQALGQESKPEVVNIV